MDLPPRTTGRRRRGKSGKLALRRGRGRRRILVGGAPSRFDVLGGANNCARADLTWTCAGGRSAALAALGVAALLMTTRVARAYVLDPIFSPRREPEVLNSVGIDPQTPLTPAEKKGAKYYGGLD